VIKQPFGRSSSEASLDSQRGILEFSAVAEGATGLALMFDPALVAALLVGPGLSSVGVVLGRCFGIALVALGLACWSRPRRAEDGWPARQAILVYNSLIALYLAHLGALGQARGTLLWPAVAVHAVVALSLVLTWRRGRRAKESVK
jgi:Ca2+/Na+ antiporter